MKNSKSLHLAIAIVIGMGGMIASALADNTVTICYRGRTITVPTYLLPRYIAQPNTTSGPCPTTSG